MTLGRVDEVSLVTAHPRRGADACWRRRIAKCLQVGLYPARDEQAAIAYLGRQPCLRGKVMRPAVRMTLRQHQALRLPVGIVLGRHVWQDPALPKMNGCYLEDIANSSHMGLVSVRRALPRPRC